MIYAIQLNSKICPIGSDRPLCLVRMKSRRLGIVIKHAKKGNFVVEEDVFFGFTVL